MHAPQVLATSCRRPWRERRLSRESRGAAAASSFFSLMTSGPAAAAASAAGVGSTSTVGAATRTTVRSPSTREVTPSGNLMSFTWMPSPTFRAETSMVMMSGKSLGKHSTSMACTESSRMPPKFLTPLGSPVVSTGISACSFSSAFTAWKSTWRTCPLRASCCTCCTSARRLVVLPPSAISRSTRKCSLVAWERMLRISRAFTESAIGLSLPP